MLYFAHAIFGALPRCLLFGSLLYVPSFCTLLLRFLMALYFLGLRFGAKILRLHLDA